LSDAQSTAPLLRQAVRALDPDLPLYRVMPMRQALDESQWNGRVSSLLFNGITAVAVCLAAFGLYAVMAHAVVQRTREIGIRVALGARRRHLVGMVARHAAAHLALGIVAGFVCTVAFARLTSSGGGGTASGYSLSDPLTLAAVGALLMAITAAASIVPAWTAARVDPLIALRYD
jgi:ABC-type antimicrobial peptide transport system permease subunit